MKLRTSFFNPTVLKKDITRFFPLWGLLTIFKVLSLSIDSGEPAYMAGNVAGTMMTLGIAQFFYGGLCARLLFGGLFNARTAGTLHALPLRREGWFLTHLAAGVILYLLPHGVEAILTGLMLWQFWYLALIRLLVGLVMFLFFFGIGALSCQCSGTKLGAMAMYMLVNFFSLVVYFVLDTFYRPLLPGIVLNNELAMYLCPVVAFTGGKFVTVKSVYDSYTGLWEAEFQGFIGGDWLQLLSAFGIMLVFLGGALLLYRRRKIESAGDFIAVRFMAPVFLVLYSFCIGAVLYLIGDDSYIFLMVGVVIGFFTGLMLLHKKVNVFRKKAWLSLGILLVLFLASLGLTKLDIFGVTTFVPQPGQVEYASLSDNIYYVTSISSGENFEEAVRLETQEELTALAEIHQLLLEKNQNAAKDIQITYKLKDGRTLIRRYSYSSNSEASKKLKPLQSRLDLFEDPEILENVVEITYNNSLGNSVPNVQILSKHLTNKNFDENFGTNVTVMHRTETTLDKDPVAKGIWEAAWQDCLEGNMSQSWEHHSQRQGYLHVKYIDEDGEWQLVSINIFTEAKNIQNYFKSLNP